MNSNQIVGNEAERDRRSQRSKVKRQNLKLKFKSRKPGTKNQTMRIGSKVKGNIIFLRYEVFQQGPL
jgi:hypothetical protein